jgi:methionine synthase II (cobalamin-independent)
LTTKNNALVTKARAYRDEVKASRAAGTKVTAVEKKETTKRPAAVAEDSEEEEEAVQPVKKAVSLVSPVSVEMLLTY